MSSNWFNSKIHSLVMEAGICRECESSNTIHKYTYDDVRQAYVYFDDKWTWEDDSAHNKEAMDILMKYMKDKYASNDDTDWGDIAYKGTGHILL